MRWYHYIWICAIFMLPIIVGYSTNTDMVFSGLLHPNDGNTYLSFMNQARDGHLLFTNMYTSEDVPYAMLRPVYLTAGLLGLLTGLPNILIYHLFRIAGIVLFVYWLEKLVSFYLEKEHERFLTVMICIFASGFGFVSYALARIGFGNLGSIDLWVTDVNNFLILLGHPHTIFSLAFFTGALYFIIRYLKSQKSKDIIVAACLALLLGFEHLFDVITIYLTLGLYLFIHLKVKDHWKHAAIFVLITGIPFAYTLYIFTQFPLFSLWNAQNVLETPNILRVFSGLGIMIVASVFYVLKKPAKNEYILVYWALASLILAYAPFNIQRRFLEGIHVPLGILTGLFIFKILPEYLKKIDLKGAYAAIFIVLMLIPTNMIVYALKIDSLDNAGHSIYEVPRYLHPEEHQALVWIAESLDSDEIILSDLKLGNYIPRYMNNRVYIGHWIQTIEFEDKHAMVLDFYEGGVLLTNLPATVAVADIRFGNIPAGGLDQIFENDLVRVYSE